MNEQTKSLMRCALADLIGAWQAYTQLDIHAHDWRAHVQTINELAEFLDERLPVELTGEI